MRGDVDAVKPVVARRRGPRGLERCTVTSTRRHSVRANYYRNGRYPRRNFEQRMRVLGSIGRGPRVPAGRRHVRQVYVGR